MDFRLLQSRALRVPTFPALRPQRRLARAVRASSSIPDVQDTLSEPSPSQPPERIHTPSRSPRCPDELIARHREETRGALILAPLTRGGTPPFRRLCVDYKCRVTMGEMTFARMLAKGDKVERTRMRKHPSEQRFGFQFATKTIAEGSTAIELAAAQGADFAGLNVGCPIYEATRRGLGSALLRKPAKLARLVAGLAEESPLPLAVKIRTGPDTEDEINVEKVVELLQGSGAATIDIHGRTGAQRYKKAARWELIEAAARASSIPVIGNGDVLIASDARARMPPGSAVHGLMVGRGALIRPWIFEEYASGSEWLPTAAERVAVYRQLAAHMRDHFGDDAKGKKKAFYFYPWHFGWFTRYRPLPQSSFAAQPLDRPLIASRLQMTILEAGESENYLELSPLERLLRLEFEEAHPLMAEAVWEAGSDQEAVARLEALAAERLEGWEAALRREEADTAARGAPRAGPEGSDGSESGEGTVSSRDSEGGESRDGGEGGYALDDREEKASSRGTSRDGSREGRRGDGRDRRGDQRGSSSRGGGGGGGTGDSLDELVMG